MSNPLRERLELKEEVITTNTLRGNLSHAINMAAYGSKPVLVTRRGRKVAAIISLQDLLLLLRARRKRKEILSRDLPVNRGATGASLAELFQDEMEWFTDS
jgi:prevent-host-death family protein